WGTQFGMIIYGYRHFVDQAAYETAPVAELGRIYRFVRRVMDYHGSIASIPVQEEKIATLEKELEAAQASPAAGDKAADKKAAKAIRRMESQLGEARKGLESTRAKITETESDARFLAIAKQHPAIDQAALEETAKLHAGDEENLALWNEFLPKCREDIQRIYDRLNVKFDHELGESFYHSYLSGVVDSFEKQGLARESEGALCVFLDGFDAPMIIRKKDGAFLYATTDLATIEYRMKEWKPDAILYVVDFRQGEHFDKLFAAARKWGYTDIELQHIKFGTVLGDDGKPYKTRSGDTVGLEGLLDTAIRRAAEQIKLVAKLPEDEIAEVANVIGHSAIKYADLSQNRESDYTYSEDKMVALKGNTATYVQYSYARTQGINTKGDINIDAVRSSDAKIQLLEDKEREIALCLLRFEEAIAEVAATYEPHHLTVYLFALSSLFAQFFEACPVLKAEAEEQKLSRLLICDLVARTIKIGLSLLGIEVVKRM
ncbi:MAG: arginine--tRNA ligase, partial [Planctomycetales bacterium]|nr:arginine--tRNA ligase [Planctomycetales bacterium]